MLKRLLALLADGQTWSNESLARALGVPSPMVDDLLARLVSEGYLSCASIGMSDACSGCAWRSPACSEASRPAVWQLTDKARRLISVTTG